MKLIANAWWSAASLAGLVVSSEALKSLSNEERSPSLHPNDDASGHSASSWPRTPEATAFLQEAVADEIAEQLNEKLVERLRADAEQTRLSDEEGGGTMSSLLKKILGSLKPALRQIFTSTTKAVKPVIAAECRRVVNEVRGVKPGPEEDEEEEEDEEDGGDMSFVTMSANGEFWDTLRETVKKGVGSLASPVLTAIATKLAPAFQKLGERIVPTFKDQIRDLVRNSCEEAEAEAGRW